MDTPQPPEAYPDATAPSCAPALGGVLETAIYVDDPERAVRFYREVLGLRAIFASARLTAMDVGGASVLLIVTRGGSVDDMPSPLGVIPGHDGAGPLHLAFKIAPDAYDAWHARFAAAGVAVAGEVRWPRGGRSLYVRDPDGHVVEFATPGLWSTY